jgi:hypothetical protein
MKKENRWELAKALSTTVKTLFNEIKYFFAGGGNGLTVAGNADSGNCRRDSIKIL